MTTAAPAPGKSLWKALIPIVLIVAVSAGVLTFVKSRAGHPGGGASVELREGANVPDFRLQPFARGEPVLASSLKAKVVLVNFWATWCEACMEEMPSIVKLREGFASQGLEVVAVNMDENPAAVLPKALKDFGIAFPVYVDTDAKLSETFDVRAIPFTVVMDRNRRVLFLEAGGRNWNSAEMQALVKQWLAG